MSANITYETEHRTLTVRKEETLLQLCLRHKVPISHSCEGMASCGTCRVLITKGAEQLEERNELELEMAEQRNYAPHERLACQLSCQNANFNFVLPEDKND